MILTDNSNKTMKLFIKNIEPTILNFLIKIFLYNERLNIMNISLDKYGFEKIKNNMINGVFDVEFHKLWKPFILKYINFHQKSLYSIVESKYEENSNFFMEYLKQNIERSSFNNIVMNFLENVL